MKILVVERSFSLGPVVSGESFDTQFLESSMSSRNHYPHSNKARIPILCSKASASKKRKPSEVIGIEHVENLNSEGLVRKSRPWFS
ncbi:hypothetical protein Hdeb2414_s0010g00330711 [Helianthus debilis subsp. tardiflorus]